MLKYWVLVTKNEQGKVVSLYSFDLKKELLENIVDKQNVTEFRVYARKKLIESLKSRNKIVFPRRFDQLENMPIGDLQQWESFKVKSNKKRPIFEKALPITGHVFNIFGILTNLFITFMTLKIAASNNNDGDSTQSTVLAILGAIFNSIINFVLYVASDATNSLIETGYRLDNLFREKDISSLEIDVLQPSRKQNSKLYGFSLTAGACILANILIGAISQYQEQSLLGKRFLELYPELSADEQKKYYELINFLVNIPSIVAFGYTGVAFQGSFARKLVINLIDKSDKSSRNEIDSFENARLINHLNNATNRLSHIKPNARESEEKKEIHHESALEVPLFNLQDEIDSSESTRLINRLNNATNTLSPTNSNVRTSEEEMKIHHESTLNVPQFNLQNASGYHSISQMENPLGESMKNTKNVI